MSESDSPLGDENTPQQTPQTDSVAESPNPPESASESQPSSSTAPTSSSQSATPLSQTKYNVTSGIKDFFSAATNNLPVLGIAIVISILLSGAILGLVFLTLAGLLLGQIGLGASFVSIIVAVVLSLIIYTLVYALIYAFISACISLSLQGKNTINQVLTRAKSVTLKLIKVNILVAIVAFWPMALAAFTPFVLFTGSGRSSISIFAVLMPLLLLAGLVWAIIALLRYALAPFVAIFEPDVSVRHTLRRSKELLASGGQWFIFKGVLLLLAIIIVVGVVTGSNLSELQTNNSITLNIFYILTSVIITGVLTVLYFNRSKMSIPESTSKSNGLMFATFAILVILVALTGGSKSSQTKFDPNNGLTKQQQEEIEKSLDEYLKTQNTNEN